MPVASPSSQETIRPDQDPRAGILVAFGVGWAWVLTLLALPVLPEQIAAVALVSNGFIAAAYLALLYWVRQTVRAQRAAIGIAAFAASHVGWLMLVGASLDSLRLELGVEDAPLMMLITGLGFAFALGFASRSWLPFVAMIAAALLAAAASAAIRGSSEFASLISGCAILHAIMVTTVTWETVRRTRALAPGVCPSCGYSLAGLPTSSPCPECGNSRCR